LIHLQTSDDASTVYFREEGCLVREVLDGPEGSEAEEDSENTLKDKNPCPARTSTKANHLLNCSCKETTKGARDCGCAKEDGSTDAELGATVPAREVVIHSWEEAGFGKTKEPLSVSVL
jgi:hypothetical protein